MTSPWDPNYAKEYIDLANAMPNLVWVCQPDGTVIYYNDRIQDFDGVFRNPDGSWAWDGAIHEEDAGKTFRLFRHSLETGEGYEVEHRLRMKTGEYRWHLTRAVPQYNEEGKIRRWYGTATDVHHQKEVERALRASEAEFRVSFENSNVGMVQTDARTMKFVRVNDAFCRMLGYSREELMCLGFADITHPDHREHDVALYKQMVSGEITELQTEKRYITKNGDIIWGLVSSNLIRDEQGNAVRSNAIIRDVTRKKKAEDALLDSEAKFKAFLHDSPLVAWSKDEDGHYVYLNYSYEKRFGVSLEQWKGKTDAELRPPEIAKLLRDNDLKVLGNEEPIMEVEYVIEDGKPSYWQSFKFVYRDSEGRRYVGGIGYDITRQQTAERASRKAQEQLDLTFRNVPVGILLFNRERTLVFANDLGAQFTGYENAAQMMHAVTLSDLRQTSKVLFDVYLDDGQLQRPDQSPVQRSFRTREGNFGVFRLVYRDGQPDKWIYYVCNPLLDDSGEVDMVISTITEVTAQKEAENLIMKEQKEWAERLEKLVARRTKELQDSNEDLQQFAHVASHDLKEPVRKIKIFGNRLLDEYGELLPERARIYLEKIGSAADRMYTMIDGVLKYSAIDGTPHAQTMVDLNEILDSIQSDLELQIHQKKAVIERVSLPVVPGIPVLLHQLFYNLINNSLKFSKAALPPRIRIMSKERIRNGSACFEISVEDNGIGFEAANAEKIFHTFSRLHPKDVYEGTGLGLALCRKIVERHQGLITASSEPGKGSVFTIMLPALPTTPANPS
jgi:PAS domain S-box-containing protein